MENGTFRTRIVGLVQRSRKALRLYSTVGKLPGSQVSDLSDLQLREWREVNAHLLKQLMTFLDSPNQRTLTTEIFGLRDYFQDLYRTTEASVHGMQRDLIAAAESGDFIKAASTSRDLVFLKARLQASQAAFTEIQAVITQSKVAPPPIELHRAEEVFPLVTSVTPSAKVIPLRRKQVAV